METKSIKIKDLKPADYNPRGLSDSEKDDLKDSIKEFGLVDPIIVNGAPKRKNVIIGGHQRWKVAKEMGFKEIPVVYVNIPSIKKEKELNLRLNKNLGHWDWDLLAKFNEEMLLKIGFGDDELGGYWDKLLGVEEDGFCIAKAIEEIKAPVTELGDIYELGKHRLMCGDSTKLSDVERLIGKNNPDMVYCDPPYNIGLNYRQGISGKKGGYGESKVKDNKKVKEYREFLSATVANALAVAKKDCHIFYWCDQNYIWLMQEILQENGAQLRRVCIWIKNNFNMTPQVAFNKVYEPCVYGTRGKPHMEKDMKNLNEILNREVGTGNEVIDDVMDIIDIWLVKRDAAQKYEHPTQKPITLNQKPMKRCTKFNDVILDLFGGSGSTLIAAEQLKRRAYLMEIDPIFCDVIIKRYEQFTKQKAKKMIWKKQHKKK